MTYMTGIFQPSIEYERSGQWVLPEPHIRDEWALVKPHMGTGWALVGPCIGVTLALYGHMYISLFVC